MADRSLPYASGAFALSLAVWITPPAAWAQTAQSGRTASISGTEVGQRQVREGVASNVEPMRRIANRVENRIQNRIRNRIDRSYAPPIQVTEAVEAAQAESARAGDARP